MVTVLGIYLDLTFQRLVNNRKLTVLNTAKQGGKSELRTGLVIFIYLVDSIVELDIA